MIFFTKIMSLIISVTRSDQLQKSLTKVAEFVTTFSPLSKTYLNFEAKNMLATLWASFGNDGQLNIAASSHTGLILRVLTRNWTVIKVVAS